MRELDSKWIDEKSNNSMSITQCNILCSVSITWRNGRRIVLVLVVERLVFGCGDGDKDGGGFASMCG